MQQPLFGVNQYTTPHWTFDEDIKFYSELGAGAIEICEIKLESSKAAGQIKSAIDAGLKIASIQAAVHTVFPDSLFQEPADPVKRIEVLKRCIDLTAPSLPPQTPFVVNTGVAPNGNFREGHDVCVEQFRELADYAAAQNMSIALEPLNPILMGQNTFIWLIPQALEMIDQIGRSNFGICLDTWNNWQDPDVLDHIQECGKLITVVHVSDWHLPRSYADRTIPGEGQIPIAELLGAIDATGYKGAYSLEIFSDESLPDSLWLQDGRTVISKSKAGFDKAWAGR